MFNMSKKKLIISITIAVIVGCLIGSTIVFIKLRFFPSKPPVTHKPRPEIELSKKNLVDGNDRYVKLKFNKNNVDQTRRDDLYKNGQKPVAAILCCSDSRVPPEIVFDEGLGDLFVVRDAGNIADSIAVGSIEYAAKHLNVPLIMVLGHENCGAVKATVDETDAAGSILYIEQEIQAAFDVVKDSSDKKDVLYTKCENQNIENMLMKIKDSPVIKDLTEKGQLDVIGAKYKIATGKVIYNYQEESAPK